MTERLSCSPPRGNQRAYYDTNTSVLSPFAGRRRGGLETLGVGLLLLLGLGVVSLLTVGHVAHRVHVHLPQHVSRYARHSDPRVWVEAFLHERLEVDDGWVRAWVNGSQGGGRG